MWSSQLVQKKNWQNTIQLKKKVRSIEIEGHISKQKRVFIKKSLVYIILNGERPKNFLPNIGNLTRIFQHCILNSRHKKVKMKSIQRKSLRHCIKQSFLRYNTKVMIHKRRTSWKENKQNNINLFVWKTLLKE